MRRVGGREGGREEGREGGSAWFALRGNAGRQTAGWLGFWLQFVCEGCGEVLCCYGNGRGSGGNFLYLGVDGWAGVKRYALERWNVICVDTSTETMD